MRSTQMLVEIYNSGRQAYCNLLNELTSEVISPRWKYFNFEVCQIGKMNLVGIVENRLDGGVDVRIDVVAGLFADCLNSC